MKRYCYCKRDGLPVHKKGCIWAGRPVKYEVPSAAERRAAEEPEDRREAGRARSVGNGQWLEGRYGLREDFHADG
jgi:hypothetical protein